jgi:tight adherence protein C
MDLIDILLPILAFLTVIGIGGAVAVAARRQKPVERLRQVAGEPFGIVSGGAGGASMLGGRPEPLPLGPLDRLGRILAGAGVSPKLRQNLARAGFSSETAAPLYLATKVILVLAGAAIGVLAVAAPFSPDIAGPIRVLVVLWFAGIGYLAPNIFIEICRRRRSAQVRAHLPDAVDLLEVCVTAGMGLEMAWNAVAEEMRPVSTVLADEMTLANLEMQLGAARAVAMRRMAERTGADELSSLVAMFVQTERFGTSIGETLRSFAGSMRDNRSHRAEEAAEKMAVKLLFPLVLFIFPVTLIVAVGPAGIAVARMITEN